MKRRMRGTRALTLSAALAALGVISLALGSLVEVLDLSMAVIASLFVTFAVIELGGSYPYLVYAVTAVLAMLLVPTKTAPLIYLCFAGYYPIVKEKLEAHLPRVFAWVLKLAVCLAALALAALLALKVFTVPVPDKRYYWLLLACVPVFVLYDVALTRLITAYMYRWRTRFTFLHK